MQSRIFVTEESMLIPIVRNQLLDFVSVKDAIDNLQVNDRVCDACLRVYVCFVCFVCCE